MFSLPLQPDLHKHRLMHRQTHTHTHILTLKHTRTRTHTADSEQEVTSLTVFHKRNREDVLYDSTSLRPSAPAICLALLLLFLAYEPWENLPGYGRPGKPIGQGRRKPHPFGVERHLREVLLVYSSVPRSLGVKASRCISIQGEILPC